MAQSIAIKGLPLAPTPGMWIEFEYSDGIERAQVTWARLSVQGEWTIRTTSPNAPVMDWHADRIRAVHSTIVGTQVWRRPGDLDDLAPGVRP